MWARDPDGRALPPVLVDQVGAELARVAVCWWPQIMALARED
jgi:hypothetical protein